MLNPTGVILIIEKIIRFVEFKYCDISVNNSEEINNINENIIVIVAPYLVKKYLTIIYL